MNNIPRCTCKWDMDSDPPNILEELPGCELHKLLKFFLDNRQCDVVFRLIAHEAELRFQDWEDQFLQKEINKLIAEEVKPSIPTKPEQKPLTYNPFKDIKLG